MIKAAGRRRNDRRTEHVAPRIRAAELQTHGCGADPAPGFRKPRISASASTLKSVSTLKSATMLEVRALAIDGVGI